MRTLRNERGIALAVAIFALVVIGALVAGAFYVGTMEQRVGRNTVLIQQAAAAAEEGAYAQIVNWNPRVLNVLSVDSLNVADSQWAFSGTVASGGRYQGRIRRLNDLVFMVTSEGFSQNDLARQRVGILARIRPIELDIRAGLETMGKTEIGGNAIISGVDTTGGLLDCPFPVDTLAGVRIPEADSIDTQGGNTTVKGQPGVEEDGSITQETLTTFGDLDWDDLRFMATKEMAPNTAATPYNIWPGPADPSCTLPTNWGEPWYPGHPNLSASRPYNGNCTDYFPVVYVNGDLHMNQQRGQGVLIVNGNLYVAGLTRFYGPVLVRGTVVAEGGGSNVPHFYGGIIAADFAGSLDSNRVAGNAAIHYSSCAIRRALGGGARAWPLKERHWVAMY